MSEGTEQPTEHKLREARKKGDRAHSKDLTVALNMLAWTIVLWSAGEHAIASLRLFMDGLVQRSFDPHGTQVPLTWLAWHAVMGVAMVAGVGLVAGLVPELIQSRGQVASRRKPFDLQRISPAAGFRKFFSLARFGELGFAIARLAVVVAISWISLRKAFGLPWLAHGRAWQASAYAFTQSAAHVLAATTAAFVALAALDLLMQHRLWIRRNRMKKEEIMREHKEQQGDPLIKGLRRDVHRQMVG